MSPLEAMTQLLSLAGIMSAPPSSHQPRTEEEQERDQLAISICQAMLNTAIPVARFRAHVSLDDGPEYTICATSIPSLQSGLESLLIRPQQGQVTVWEQRAQGADMLSGYQGFTKSKQYRLWLKSLHEHEAPSTAVN